jgi:hypothetical protein
MAFVISFCFSSSLAFFLTFVQRYLLFVPLPPFIPLFFALESSYVCLCMYLSFCWNILFLIPPEKCLLVTSSIACVTDNWGSFCIGSWPLRILGANKGCHRCSGRIPEIALSRPPVEESVMYEAWDKTGVS